MAGTGNPKAGAGVGVGVGAGGSAIGTGSGGGPTVIEVAPAPGSIVGTAAPSGTGPKDEGDGGGSGCGRVCLGIVVCLASVPFAIPYVVGRLCIPLTKCCLCICGCIIGDDEDTHNYTYYYKLDGRKRECSKSEAYALADRGEDVWYKREKKRSGSGSDSHCVITTLALIVWALYQLARCMARCGACFLVRICRPFPGLDHEIQVFQARMAVGMI